MRVGFRVGDDDVIQQFDLKNLGRFAQGAGDVDVRRTWSGIARGMVVRYAKSDCVRQEGTTKYSARRDQRSGSCSQGDEVATEGMIFLVEITSMRECPAEKSFLIRHSFTE